MTDVLILAAGLGTRMKSRRAKVLHQIAGLPIISHIVKAASQLEPDTIITIVGHQADAVEQAVRAERERLLERDGKAPSLEFVLQSEQRGTGHAVIAARATLEGRKGPVVVLAGDVPMIEGSTLGHLADAHVSEQNAVTMLTVRLDEPTGYGRIIRDSEGGFVRSVEQKDATPEELLEREVGVSIYCFDIPTLLDALDHLTTDNAQGEYYLTDVPRIVHEQGKRVGLVPHHDPEEVAGVNTRV